jgi:hypothetical protein
VTSSFFIKKEDAKNNKLFAIPFLQKSEKVSNSACTFSNQRIERQRQHFKLNFSLSLSLYTQNQPFAPI